jgi:hypothetical protein
VSVTGARREETLASASRDLLLETMREFAWRMTDADIEIRCDSGYG